MKNGIYKKIAIVLAGLAGSCVIFSSCIDQEQSEVPPVSGTPGVTMEGEYTFDTILNDEKRHIRLQTETEHKIVSNGKTEYKILAPKEMEDLEATAVDEMVALFKEATGIELEVVQNDAFAYTENVKYISIGKTSFVEELGIELTYQQLGQQGYVIQTRGASIIVTGQAKWGTLYGVYDLLGEWFNYNYFAPNVYSLNKRVSDLPLKNYNIKEVPDIGAFQRNYGDLYEAKGAINVAKRYRMTDRDETVLAINGTTSVHNSLLILPYEEFSETHPLWYTNWKETIVDYAYEENLCYTAHGDGKEYKALVTAMRDEIIEEFKAGATGNIMILGLMDGAPNCECEYCTINTEKYGAKSANGILFVSDLLDSVYTWFETEEGKAYKREFFIDILAYQDWEDGPFTYDKTTDTYSMNGGLKFHEKQGVMMAPIKYDFGGTHTEFNNQIMWDNAKAWMHFASNCMFYLYDFNNYVQFAPWDTLASKQEWYQLMSEANALYLYDQGEWLQTGLPTGFSLPKIYVMTKLRWNTQLSVNGLLNEYFDYVYGEASQTMSGVYWSFRNHWTNMRELAKVPGSGIEAKWVNYLSARIHRAELWPFQLLKGWLNSYDEAFDAIEILKESDSAAYERISLYISAERASTLWLLITLYPDHFSETELLNLKLQFKEDTTLSGVSGLAENTHDGATVGDLLIQWGIAE